MRKPTLQKAESQIVSWIEQQEKKILKEKVLFSKLNEERVHWKLANYLTPAKIAGYLIEKGYLHKHVLTFANKANPKAKQLNHIRYCFHEPNEWELIQSLGKEGYFSHSSALFLHQLTEQVPKTLFFKLENVVRKIAPKQANLTQESINYAFQQVPRQTHYCANIGNYTVYQLAGHKTNGLGITSINYRGAIIQVTDIERTLIDIVVRPYYAGGIDEIIKAFQNALEIGISVNKLGNYLRKLDYIYPYHQAIGFYMEQAGNYRPAQIDILRKMERHFDFYLMNQMVDMEYDPTWRLFYPKGLR